MSVSVVGKQYVKFNHAPSKKEKSAKKAGLGIARELGSEGTAQKAVKLTNKALGFLKHIPSVLKDEQVAMGHFNTAVDIFKTLSIFANIKPLVDAIRSKPQPDSKHPHLDKHLKNLKIASSVLGIADGITGLTKLFGTFNVIDLSKASLQLGPTPVFGTAVPAIPVGSFFNILDIAKAAVDISISSIYIHLLCKAEKRIGQKQIYWNAPELSEEFMKKRIQHFQVKREKVETAKKKLEETLDATDVQAARNSKKSITAYNALVDHHTLLENRLAALDKKIEKWAKTRLTAPEIESYKADKLKKWKVKEANLKLSKLKEGLSIALNIVLISLLITSIVITILGIGTVSSVLLPLSAIALALVIASTAHGLFKQYAKPKKVPQVELPTPPVPRLKPRRASMPI